MEDIPTPQRIQPINIRKIFQGKNAALARLLPGFFFRYLERIVHQKDINAFLEKHGDKMGLDFVRAAIKDFNVSVSLIGSENLPSKGRFIFASNHPLGGFDGILLMEVMSRFYPDFKFLSNDLLMNIVNLRPIFLEINKHGKQGSGSVMKLDEAFRSDCQIVTFPAGLVSRKFKGTVMDLVWQKNFISKAVKFERDVIPLFFSGHNSAFFYGLHKVRNWLHIKANLEMFYLVDETYKHRNDHLTITFGTPISYKTFDKSKSPMEWAKWVKQRVYALGGIDHVPF